MLYSQKIQFKGGMLTLYEKILDERNKLDKKISSLQKKITKMPSGTLVCTKNSKHFKWYHRDKNQYEYIPKSQQDFAKKLALKTYYSSMIDDLSHEKNALDSYLKKHKKYSSDDLLKNKEFLLLLSSHFLPLSEELRLWSLEKYESNPYSPESLIHPSSSGYLLRSKSEANIFSFLHGNSIPFRYEVPLALGNHTIYPDFTIRHPGTGEFYYWEHFGMMDNPEYSKKTFSKIAEYNEHGIVPSVNLIMTFETKKHPLGIDTIEKVATEYFL